MSLTFAPDIGFGARTIPGDTLTQAAAPVLFKVLGEQRMHAEDRSYQEIEKLAHFPASTTQYPVGTINVNFGYQPDDYELGPNKMYKLKDDVVPHIISMCSTESEEGKRTTPCTTIARKLRVIMGEDEEWVHSSYTSSCCRLCRP